MGTLTPPGIFRDGNPGKAPEAPPPPFIHRDPLSLSIFAPITALLQNCSALGLHFGFCQNEKNEIVMSSRASDR
jgi:hypothetical protein